MYDTPLKRSYNFPNVVFSGSDIEFGIAVPVGDQRSHTSGIGMPGKVIRVLIHNVTEDFTATASGIKVGTGSDDGTYYDSGAVIGTDVDIGETLTPADANDPVVAIPEGRTDVTVTCEADSDAGIADVSIDIDWY